MLVKGMFLTEQPREWVNRDTGEVSNFIVTNFVTGYDVIQLRLDKGLKECGFSLGVETEVEIRAYVANGSLRTVLAK